MLNSTMLDILIIISIIMGAGLLGAVITFVFKRFAWLRRIVVKSRVFEGALLSTIRNLLIRSKLINETHVDKIVNVVKLTIDFVFDYTNDGQLDSQEVAKFISNTMDEFDLKSIPNRDAIIKVIADIMEDVYRFI